MTQTGKRPAVFAKFVEKEILGEWGRLLFSLLDAFASSGYEIRLFDSIPREDLGKYGPLVFSLQHLTLTDAQIATTTHQLPEPLHRQVRQYQCKPDWNRADTRT